VLCAGRHWGECTHAGACSAAQTQDCAPRAGRKLLSRYAEARSVKHALSSQCTRRCRRRAAAGRNSPSRLHTSCARGTQALGRARRAAGESLLEEAVAMAARAGLVHARDHVVVVQMLADAFVVKIVSVDEHGYGIQAIRPKSLVDLMMARA